MKKEEYTSRYIQDISSLTHRLWSVLGVITFAICGFGCTPKPVNPTDYGISYNHVRDSIGLKQIPKEWADISRKKGDVILYTNPCVDSLDQNPRAYYAGKVLNIINDSLIYETDQYALVRFPSPKQVIVLALLDLSYYYYPNKYISIINDKYLLKDAGWYVGYWVNNSPKIDSVVQRYGVLQHNLVHDDSGMTWSKADSILTAWGMKYP